MNKQNFLITQKPVRQKADYKAIVFLSFKLLGEALLVCIGLFFVGLILILILALPNLTHLKNIYNYANYGKVDFETAEQLILNKDFDEAVDYIKNAEINFTKARQSIDEIKDTALYKTPYLQDQFIVVDDVLQIGQKASQLALSFNSVGVDIKNVFQSNSFDLKNLPLEKKGEVLQILISANQKIINFDQELKNIEDLIFDINSHQPNFLIASIIEPIQVTVPKISQAFYGFSTIYKFLPDFTGFPTEKNYLLILQNNREMRPSGGFIGTYGILTIQNGEIQNLFLDNSYNLDRLVEDTLNIPSPEPMAKYMNQPKWFMRDANWWPDFKTSAEKIKYFYEIEGGQVKIDGVLAFSPTVIEELMKVLGEFNVDGLNFNKDNFWEQLQYQVEFGYYQQGISEVDRKDIIGDLAKQMIDKVFHLQYEEIQNTAQILADQIKQKQLLFYFVDPNKQKLAEEVDWAGQVKQTDYDYVMLVDANLAALKTDSVMTRQMNYKISPDDNGYLAEVKVNYINNGEFSWKTTRYRTYTRLYVPEGSDLIQIKVGNKIYTQDEIDYYNEFNKTAWGIFFEVEPKTSQEVIWQYRLPNDIIKMMDDNKYDLLIQKQPGIIEMDLNLDLNFDKNIKTKDLFKNKQLQYFDLLTQDQTYHVLLTP